MPGSKNTIEDLIELRNNGLAEAIILAHQNQQTVIGVCGGYQMLGQTIKDPGQIESDAEEIEGLGILPVETVLLNEKTTRQCSFTYRDFSEKCIGYEIHMGETKVYGAVQPVAWLDKQHTDGYFLSEKCWGSYLHGILDNQVVINDLVAPYTDLQVPYVDYLQFRSEQYDKLAVLLRENLDIEQVYQHLKD